MTPPAAIITKRRYGFAEPDYHLLDVASGHTIAFTTAQEVGEFAELRYAGRSVEWRLDKRTEQAQK